MPDFLRIVIDRRGKECKRRVMPDSVSRFDRHRKVLRRNIGHSADVFVGSADGSTPFRGRLAKRAIRD